MANSVEKVRMTPRITRWWAVEVAREFCANDNMDSAEWCAMWTRMADMMAAKNWKPQEMAMRAAVAVARANNRPVSV